MSIQFSFTYYEMLSQGASASLEKLAYLYLDHSVRNIAVNTALLGRGELVAAATTTLVLSVAPVACMDIAPEARKETGA